MIRDDFGDTVANRVCLAVYERISSFSSSSALTARIGGGVFAVLFQGVTPSIWKFIVSQLGKAHASLTRNFTDSVELGVTVSVGLAFSGSGYDRTLFDLAMKALTETRKRGRAGCTQVDRDGTVLKYWHDDTLSMLAKNVLECNNTGICRIEMPDDHDVPIRLLCGPSVKMMLSIPLDATPEECFRIWRDGIDPAYSDVIRRSMLSMVNDGQTECTFLWKHPSWGLIKLRCGGFGEKKPGMTVLSGYCHTLKDTAIIERDNEQSLILNALSNVYAATFYLNIEDGTLFAVRIDSGAQYVFQDTGSLSVAASDFLSNVVDPRDLDVMRNFLDMSSIEQRIGSDRFIDAEYRSRLLGSWCRARLIPVKRNEEGRLSNVLLTITALDPANGYTLDYDRRSLASLFDHVPAGIVMYEWDGHELNAVHVSRYCQECFDHTFIENGEDGSIRPNYAAVHPDDAKGFVSAVRKAMHETHELHYEYRAYSEKVKDYIWERLDAVFSTPLGSRQFIYAVYTNITWQREQALRLEKAHASLLAALDASNQLCYEYDPRTHVGICLTDDNFFALPKYIENYPASLLSLDLFHPDDEALFVAAAHKIDEGEERSSCDVRIKKDGQYCWYSCTFNAYYDSEKAQNVALLTVVDISIRMATLKTYEDRLHSLASITENTLCMCNFNLIGRTYQVIECKEEVKEYLNASLDLDDFIVNVSKAIVSQDGRNNFNRIFNVDNLLSMAEQGIMHTQFEYMIRIGANHYELVRSGIDLVINPINGEVSGVAYTRSIQTEKMSSALLEKTLEQDFLFAAAIFVDTDEFYLYNSRRSQFTPVMQNYWDAALSNVNTHCSEKTLDKLKTVFVKKTVLEYLMGHDSYAFAFDSFLDGRDYRLEVRFCYMDAEHNMLLASMRDITDTAMLDQYRHDSEHDPLTDLYNRKKLFERCRQLLDEHPDARFVMVHIDIKHFRLFNTFYGDDAGDRLLCDIADQLRLCDDDLEYWAYGRIEADVFAAFFPYDDELYKSRMARMLEYVENRNLDFRIELALGMYFVQDRTMSIESMFTRATMAAKTVRSDTPYSTSVFDAAMEETLIGNQLLLNEMQAGIEDEQFKVYLQPKYSLRTNKPVGAEALVRWIHPSRGLLSPARFIPLFESNGSISDLDHYMWEHVCQILASWKRAGLPLMPISVNCSRISIYSQETVSVLERLVQEYDIDPAYLELELTESAYVDSPDDIRPRIAELQKYGFKILMDDFGSGYSSLNTLKDLPIDVLKLDMKFLSASNTTRGGKILSSIIRMCKLLGLAVIAEGVETETQAGYLRSLGCEYVQGYLFARPMPVPDFESRISSSLAATDQIGLKAEPSSKVIDALLDPSTSTRVIDETVPNPVAIIGLQNGELCFLRANLAFLDSFGMKEDLSPASRLFKKHLSASEYDRLLRALVHCGETRRAVSFKLNWKGESCYLVNVVYEGNVGVEQVFVVAFINTDPEGLFE